MTKQKESITPQKYFPTAVILMTILLDSHGIIQYNTCTQCWKFPQVRQSKADNFGVGPGTFC